MELTPLQLFCLEACRAFPTTGYDIFKMLKNLLSNTHKAHSHQQIYRESAILVTKGLLTKTVKPQIGKPDKHLLSITNKGKAALHKARQFTDVPKDSKPMLDLATFYVLNLSNRAYFKALYDVHIQELNTVNKAIADCTPTHAVSMALLQQRKARLEADVQFAITILNTF